MELLSVKLPSSETFSCYLRILLGKRLDFPPFLENSPFLLVFTCTLSFTGQPVFLLQEVKLKEKSSKKAEKPKKISRFFIIIQLLVNLKSLLRYTNEKMSDESFAKYIFIC